MKLEWFMTNPHRDPKRAHKHGADDGRVGWRWHAVPEGASKYRPALCGLRPAHGWGGDLFANEMCERCRKIVLRRGVALPDWLVRSMLAEYRLTKP